MSKISENFILGKQQPTISPEHQISIQAIRWIKTETAKPPLKAKNRIFIILNAHQMSIEAQNAFLKTLEAPPPDTMFILTTTNRELLLSTIRSRCRLIRFANISHSEIVSYLKNNFHVGEEDAQFAATVAEGSLGKAITAIKNLDDFFFPPILKLLTEENKENSIPDVIEEIDRSSLLPAVSTAIFIYRNTLRAKIGLSHLPQFIHSSISNLKISAIKEKLQFLHTMSQQLHHHTHPLLTSYYLVSTIVQ